MTKETLRLFNSILITEPVESKATQAQLQRMINHGYILEPKVEITSELLDTIEDVVGISGEKANAAFHKSWNTIKDTPIEVLVIQQIFHYITTYGFEAMGIYDESTVYIPAEKLEIPEVTEDIRLTLVKCKTAGEVLADIVNLAGSGIALAQETLDDIMVIVKANDFDKAYAKEVKNRELKALLYDYYMIVPDHPVEFLRHVISKLTGESLLIKNRYLIGKIKEADGKFLDMLLADAPANLASIFYRYKPLFLAMKSISVSRKGFFNKLRKDAVRMHRPLPKDVLGSVTADIKKDKVNYEELKDKLEDATIFRKVRLLYALHHRVTAGTDNIVHTVRNGRGWAKKFDWPAEAEDDLRMAANIVYCSVVDSVAKNVEGKVIYIPDFMDYALPATEKQFTGFMPTGSSITLDTDMIIGIYWEDINRHRIDLDLALSNKNSKIGWDGRYRNDNILFSGDLTSAPNGASELFHIREGSGSYLMTVNYFNYMKDVPVPTKILASVGPRDLIKKRNYLVDPNDILATANITVDKKQSILGLVSDESGVNKFYFTNVGMGNAISARSSDILHISREYLFDKFTNMISLVDILDDAGAIVVSEIPVPKEGEEPVEFIDLSPEKLDKTTIIDLIK